jgi:hypothetical protein
MNDISKPSQYNRVLDPTNPNWTPQPDYVDLFLRSQQAYANDMLQSRGHVFLNEVYDMLGFDRSVQGAICGWLKEDGPIQFHIIDEDDVFTVDFNVSGVIYDKIEEGK